MKQLACAFVAIALLLSIFAVVAAGQAAPPGQQRRPRVTDVSGTVTSIVKEADKLKSFVVLTPDKPGAPGVEITVGVTDDTKYFENDTPANSNVVTRMAIVSVPAIGLLNRAGVAATVIVLGPVAGRVKSVTKQANKLTSFVLTIPKTATRPGADLTVNVTDKTTYAVNDDGATANAVKAGAAATVYLVDFPINNVGVADKVEIIKFVKQ